MKKILLILTFSIVSLFAYDVEREGDWWYIYDGNDIVGAYSKGSWGDYYVGCDSPKLSQSQKKYIDSSNYYLNKTYSSKREAKNAIIKYCKRR